MNLLLKVCAKISKFSLLLLTLKLKPSKQDHFHSSSSCLSESINVWLHHCKLVFLPLKTDLYSKVMF